MWKVWWGECDGLDGNGSAVVYWFMASTLYIALEGTTSFSHECYVALMFDDEYLLHYD